MKLTYEDKDIKLLFLFICLLYVYIWFKLVLLFC